MNCLRVLIFLICLLSEPGFASYVEDRYRLVGVIAGDKSASSVAIIEDQSSKKSVLMRLDRPIPGNEAWRVVRIERQLVEIESNGARVSIVYDPAGSPSSTASSEKTAPTTPSPEGEGAMITLMPPEEKKQSNYKPAASGRGQPLVVESKLRLDDRLDIESIEELQNELEDNINVLQDYDDEELEALLIDRAFPE